MRDNMGLYHAKRTYNGKWVEGCLVVTPQGDAYIISTAETKRDVNVLINQCSLNVDPKTIGQYTGLTDRNGKRIFEGDICKFKRFNDVHIGKVVFNVTTASFIMWYQPIVGAYGEKATQKMLLSVCDNIEVVGNIHDNPELLR